MKQYGQALAFPFDDVQRAWDLAFAVGVFNNLTIARSVMIIDEGQQHLFVSLFELQLLFKVCLTLVGLSGIGCKTQDSKLCPCLGLEGITQDSRRTHHEALLILLKQFVGLLDVVQGGFRPLVSYGGGADSAAPLSTNDANRDRMEAYH